MLPIYSPLLTDLYELTMAYGYWQLGMHEQEAVFHLLFRNAPFKGQYALNCGLSSVIAFLNQWRFQGEDLAYLANLKTATGSPLFSAEFLSYLQQLRFSCDVDAIPEGTIVYPQVPLIRIQGPLLQGQLLETALLNFINFQTLIATKASRIYHAAQGDTLIEFGLRRAQGPDGALAASRAAYVGGCAATSNTLAGQLYNIPVRGTHAHSWVTAFADEQTAFDAYAKVLPDNSVLLVDTYDTLQGVKHAIQTGKKLRANGSELTGVRLDSGDLASLSIKARALLDEAGFAETQILASNSLDEYVIADLKAKGAKISAWGVGTNLITAYDQPALDGVYKLAALKDQQGQWQYRIKLSEQVVKVSNPGIQQVRRFFKDDHWFADVIYDTQLGISEQPHAVSFNPAATKKHLNNYTHTKDLLVPIFRRGQQVYVEPTLAAIRDQALANLSHWWALAVPSTYPVALEEKLYDVKKALIAQFSSSELIK